MSANIVVDDSVNVVGSSTRVEQDSQQVTMESNNEVQAVVTSQDFVVTTASALGFATGGMPSWLVASIDIALSDGFADQEEVIRDLSVLIAGIEVGVNQSISSIETEVLSQNIKIDTNKSELDGNTAAIIGVSNTLVDEYSSTAESTEILAAEFESNNALVLSQAEATSSANMAESSVILGLVAKVDDPITGNSSLASSREITYSSVGMNPDGSMNGQAGFWGQHDAAIGDLEVRLTTEEGVSAGDHEWDGSEDPLIGMWRDNAGTYETFMGGFLGWTENNELNASTAETWAYAASKFGTGPDGEITGWGFGDSTNMNYSEFIIKADIFQISNGASGLTPFLVNTVENKIEMNTDVIIDGDLLVEGTVSVDSLKVGFGVNLLDIPLIQMRTLYGHEDECTVYNMETAVVSLNSTIANVEPDVVYTEATENNSTAPSFIYLGGSTIDVPANSKFIISGYARSTGIGSPSLGAGAKVGLLIDGSFKSAWVAFSQVDEWVRIQGVIDCTDTSAVTVARLFLQDLTNTGNGNTGVYWQGLQLEVLPEGSVSELASPYQPPTQHTGEIYSSDFTTIAAGTGFRLKSGAEGTEADPTIYGSYILGSTIKGATIEGGTVSAETDITAANIIANNLYYIDDGGSRTRLHIHTVSASDAEISQATTFTVPLGFYSPGNTSAPDNTTVTKEDYCTCMLDAGHARICEGTDTDGEEVQLQIHVYSGSTLIDSSDLYVLQDGGTGTYATYKWTSTTGFEFTTTLFSQDFDGNASSYTVSVAPTVLKNINDDSGEYKIVINPYFDRSAGVHILHSMSILTTNYV